MNKTNSTQSILVIDDEHDIRELLALALIRDGYEPLLANTAAEAKIFIESDRKIDCCLTDVRLPDGDGIDIVKLFKQHRPSEPIAVMTAYDSSQIAVEAMRAGAFDFLPKPIRQAKLTALLADCLKPKEDAQKSMDDFIGKTPVIDAIRNKMSKVSASHAPILIQGLSGTGKSLCANLIHKQSNRHKEPVITINCAALSNEKEAQSTFFGIKKTYENNSNNTHLGCVQLAENSTLILEDIDALPQSFQPKLLKALEEKHFTAVDSDNVIPFNTRLICTSKADMASLVNEGRFRQDLYYFINVINLELPKLRKRTEDIPLLCEHILQTKVKSKRPCSIDDNALKALSLYRFPGNVRELENVLSRAATLCQNYTIDVTSLELEKRHNDADMPQQNTGIIDVEQLDDIEGYMATIEKKLIEQTLESLRWNKSAVANKLGLTMRQLRYKLAKHNIDT